MGENRPSRGERPRSRGRESGASGPTLPIAGKVTVKDIARAAGVSVATVSRVLNNPQVVAADKREAVLRALHSHDYIPNQQARSLISRRSRAIGLIVPTIANPVFAPTIDAIEREVDQAGYALLIHCCERDPERELNQVRGLIERGVDGLIITGSVHMPQLGDLLARNRMPFVSQDVTLDLALGPSIALDNVGAMEAAIDYLYDQGHRTIAVFSGPIHNTPPVRDRLYGAMTRIRHHGLDLAELLVRRHRRLRQPNAARGVAALVGTAGSADGHRPDRRHIGAGAGRRVSCSRPRRACGYIDHWLRQHQHGPVCRSAAHHHSHAFRRDGQDRRTESDGADLR